MNTTKKCHFCKEDILQDATICKHCGKKQPRSLKTIGKVILGIFVIGIIGAAFSDDDKQPVAVQTPQKEVVKLTEAQCQVILKSLYDLVSDGTAPNQADPTYKITKSLLEQKVIEGGLNVSTRTSPNTEYVLPTSKCGENANSLMGVIVQGEKNARKN